MTRLPGTRTSATGAFGTFSEVITTRGATEADSVFATDLDGDGDADVLSASSGTTTRSPGTRISAGVTFGAQQVIINQSELKWPESVYADGLGRRRRC
jgi:hypothetical protein